MNTADIETITTDDIIDVLGERKVDTEEILKCAVHYARTDKAVSGEAFGKCMAHMAHKVMQLEEALKNAAQGQIGAPVRPSRPKKVAIPDLPGTMHQKALDANLPDTLKAGDKADVPCPDCGAVGMDVRGTRDGTRLFLGCQNYRASGCKGSISYKSFP